MLKPWEFFSKTSNKIQERTPIKNKTKINFRLYIGSLEIKMADHETKWRLNIMMSQRMKKTFDFSVRTTE